MALASPDLGYSSSLPHCPGFVSSSQTPVLCGSHPGTHEGQQPRRPSPRTPLGPGPLATGTSPWRLPPGLELLPRRDAAASPTCLRHTQQTSPTTSWRVSPWEPGRPQPTPHPKEVPAGAGERLEAHALGDDVNGVPRSFSGPSGFCVAYLCSKHIKMNLRDLL